MYRGTASCTNFRKRPRYKRLGVCIYSISLQAITILVCQRQGGWCSHVPWVYIYGVFIFRSFYARRVFLGQFIVFRDFSLSSPYYS